MLEKIKDLCYDLSDILLSLLIISIIFFVISWKISDSLDFKTIPNNISSQQADIINTSTSTVVESENLSKNSPDTSDNSNSINPEDNTPIEGSESSTQVPNPSGTQNQTSEPSTTSKPSSSKGTQTISIVSGASGASIAKQLYDAGLVESTSIFISRLGERNLGAKLQTGTFKLSADMTIDQIIDKLTGQ